MAIGRKYVDAGGNTWQVYEDRGNIAYPFTARCTSKKWTDDASFTADGRWSRTYRTAWDLVGEA